MRAVAVAELVYESCVELEVRAVDVVFHALVAVSVESVYHGGLYVELPSLLLAQVEREVDGCL